MRLRLHGAKFYADELKQRRPRVEFFVYRSELRRLNRRRSTRRLAPVAVRLRTPRPAPDITTGGPRAYRRELTGYCYRMLGSVFEADDAVQETMVRAWRNVDSFEGRSSVRSWLYRIATNVCLDMLRSRQRRALAMDLGPSSTADSFLGATKPERRGSRRSPSHSVVPDDGDPAEVAAARESIRLAFVTALQHLPPRQRAVLILREVLRWQATRGRRAARHERRVGQQRAPARESDAVEPHGRQSPETEVVDPRASRNCSPVTSTRSSATTSRRSSRCCARTR